MSRDELAEMLALVPDQWHLFFWFLVATGVRISEVVALQWRHLELDAPVPPTSRSAARSSRAAWDHPRAATVVEISPSIRCSPRRSTSTTRLQTGRVARTPYSQWPTDRRLCPITSSGECSNPLGRLRTFRGSASTLSVILRVHPVRGRPQRHSGPALARSSLGRVHARDLCAPARRRPRGAAGNASGGRPQCRIG